MFQSEITSPYSLDRSLISAAEPSEASSTFSNLLQEVADDANHRSVVVDDEDRHRVVNSQHPAPWDVRAHAGATDAKSYCRARTPLPETARAFLHHDT